MAAAESDSRRLGSLGRGAVTGGALAVQQGLAAVVGVIIAREFGRSSETDGFFAAYGLFLVVALIATATRVVLLPQLARAREQRRLGAETTAYALSFAVLAGPLLLSIALAGPVATALTGYGPDAARDSAEAALPWIVVAAVGQLYAGLAASALAALDDYVVAAAGYAVGSVAGVALIVWRVGEDGIVAVSWGMALNAIIAVGVPAVALGLRARREAMPRGAAHPNAEERHRRLLTLMSGVALPLALQAVYLVCLPLAAREGVGAVTSMGYAYLAGSALVAMTATSLALVTSVPLTRVGLDAARVARHVVCSAWIALVAVGATVGAFAVAGEPLAKAVLGDAYGNRVGEELGLVLLALAPWIVVTIGVSVTFPLVFVTRRGERLPWIALLVFVVHVPLAWAGQELAGLYGLALALALSTGAGLVAMLVILGAARHTLWGLGHAAAIVGVVALGSFAGPAAVTDSVVAAILGTALYSVVLAVVRPSGLRVAWRYLRELS